ncbi:hypothetical protein PC115_g8459 [Phytophthora cactorum]|uniref:Uncharacterized protein n=1 Tax=Phytophthora cactorum TaxID=29920 RepID=A0A8T1CMS5_9STRA|nr:hypothetical protein PC115_g8459 [Phytophthora cactorum]
MVYFKTVLSEKNLRGRKSLKKTKLPGSSGLEKSGGSASGSGFSRRCGVSKILTLLRQPSQTRCSEHSMT